MNSGLFDALAYLKTSDVFHQWTDKVDVTWGLNFASKQDADEFSDLVADLVEQIASGATAPAPTPTTVVKTAEAPKQTAAKPEPIQTETTKPAETSSSPSTPKSGGAVRRGGPPAPEPDNQDFATPTSPVASTTPKPSEVKKAATPTSTLKKVEPVKEEPPKSAAVSQPVKAATTTAPTVKTETKAPTSTTSSPSTSTTSSPFGAKLNPVKQQQPSSTVSPSSVSSPSSTTNSSSVQARAGLRPVSETTSAATKPVSNGTSGVSAGSKTGMASGGSTKVEGGGVSGQSMTAVAPGTPGARGLPADTAVNIALLRSELSLMKKEIVSEMHTEMDKLRKDIINELRKLLSS